MIEATTLIIFFVINISFGLGFLFGLLANNEESINFSRAFLVVLTIFPLIIGIILGMILQKIFDRIKKLIIKFKRIKD